MPLNLSLQPKQTEAFTTEANECFYSGAAGSGKSHLMRVASIAWCADIPGLQVYLFRRTSPDLLANHMSGPSGFPALLGELVDEKHVQINYSKNEIRFWNGSVIHLCHCQHDKDMYNYQGAEIHVLLIDELTHFAEEVYRYLRGRVRLGGLKIPDHYYVKNPDGSYKIDECGQKVCLMPRILAGANPGGVGHAWVKRTFIDFAPPMTIQKMSDSEGGFRRQFIPAYLKDNQILIQNDPNYLSRLKGLGSDALVSAMAEGNWDIPAGGYFDGVWNRNVHVLEPFEVPSSWRIDRSFDWGSSKPFSVGYWAESDGTEAVMADGTIRHFKKGTLFRIDEIYGWSGTPDEGVRWTAKKIAQRVNEFEKERSWGSRAKPGPADSAIYTKENGPSIADDMLEEGVRWIPADKRPGSRRVGWLNMVKRLEASKVTPMEEPGLFIFANCLQFIRTVPGLPRDPNDSEDIYSKAEDHVADEARYRCNMQNKELRIVPTSGL